MTETSRATAQQITDVVNRLNRQADALLEFAESGMPPAPKELRDFMLNSSEAADLLSSIVLDGFDPNSQQPEEPKPETTDQQAKLASLSEKWKSILDLANRQEIKVLSTFEAFRKLHPEIMECEILVGDTTEQICVAMDRANITCAQLAKKVGWSKKKLRRVLSGDISVKQLARLLNACGYRAEITIEANHEVTT